MNQWYDRHSDRAQRHPYAARQLEAADLEIKDDLDSQRGSVSGSVTGDEGDEVKQDPDEMAQGRRRFLNKGQQEKGQQPFLALWGVPMDLFDQNALQKHLWAASGSVFRARRRPPL